MSMLIMFLMADSSHYRRCRGSVFFSSWYTFQHMEREILSYFGYFVAIFRIFWCAFTGLDNAVVQQNCTLLQCDANGGEKDGWRFKLLTLFCPLDDFARQPGNLISTIGNVKKPKCH